MIGQVTSTLTKLFDITATKDYANCHAKADIVVDGTVLLQDVPATYLLFLEKQLVDVHTFISTLPVLDASETWRRDESSDCWATEAIQTLRTKKVYRNHVKAEATDKNPAQVEVYYEDVSIGTWRTVKFSGSLPAKRVNELTQQVRRLQEAVKFARETANSAQAEEVKVGESIFGYIFN